MRPNEVYDCYDLGERLVASRFTLYFARLLPMNSANAVTFFKVVPFYSQSTPYDLRIKITITINNRMHRHLVLPLSSDRSITQVNVNLSNLLTANALSFPQLSSARYSIYIVLHRIVGPYLFF